MSLIERIRIWRIRRAHRVRHRLLDRLRSIERHIDKLQEPDVQREQELHEMYMDRMENLRVRLLRDSP